MTKIESWAIIIALFGREDVSIHPEPQVRRPGSFHFRFKISDFGLTDADLGGLGILGGSLSIGALTQFEESERYSDVSHARDEAYPGTYPETSGPVYPKSSVEAGVFFLAGSQAEATRTAQAQVSASESVEARVEARGHGSGVAYEAGSGRRSGTGYCEAKAGAREEWSGEAWAEAQGEGPPRASPKAVGGPLGQ